MRLEDLKANLRDSWMYKYLEEEDLQEICAKYTRLRVKRTPRNRVTTHPDLLSKTSTSSQNLEKSKNAQLQLNSTFSSTGKKRARKSSKSANKREATISQSFIAKIVQAQSPSRRRKSLKGNPSLEPFSPKPLSQLHRNCASHKHKGTFKREEEVKNKTHRTNEKLVKQPESFGKQNLDGLLDLSNSEINKEQTKLVKDERHFHWQIDLCKRLQPSEGYYAPGGWNEVENNKRSTFYPNMEKKELSMGKNCTNVGAVRPLTGKSDRIREENEKGETIKAIQSNRMSPSNKKTQTREFLAMPTSNNEFNSLHHGRDLINQQQRSLNELATARTSFNRCHSIHKQLRLWCYVWISAFEFVLILLVFVLACCDPPHFPVPT